MIDANLIIASNSENERKLIRYSGPPHLEVPPLGAEKAGEMSKECFIILGAILLGIFTGLLINGLVQDRDWWRSSYYWFWIVVFSQLWGGIGYYIYRIIKSYRDQKLIEQQVAEELGLVRSKRITDEYLENLVNERLDKRIQRRRPQTPEAVLFYEKITSEVQGTLEKPISSITMRSCPFCGAENEATARFCSKCKVWLPALKS